MGSSLLILVCAAMAAAAPPASKPAGVASQPARLTAFQPGIRFDWKRREVLADATVILREGLIELFACAPRQREHEAIVRLEARPLHLYQALGLIGLRPGHPIRLNEDTEQIEPAVGDPVHIEVRYERNGQTIQEPIEAWMRIEQTGQMPARLPWILAGSLNTPDGFAADHEGTVIAVVDFGTSLIGLPEQHSAANEELWLAPATDRIPPLGTRCVLVLRAGPMRLEVDRAARIRLNGQAMTRAELARRLSALVREDPNVRVDLLIDPQAPVSEREGIEKLLRMIGVRPKNLSTSRPAASAEPRHDPEAFRAWMRQRWTAAGPPQSAKAGNAAERLFDDLRERGLLLRARAEALSASLAALSQQAGDFISAPQARADVKSDARSE